MGKRPGSRIAFMLCVALCCLGLVACGGEETAIKVKVTGAGDERPTITFTTPLAVEDASTKMIWAGSGHTIRRGEHLLVNYRAVRASDGSVIGDTYDSQPQTWVYGPDLPLMLYKTLSGVKVGSRVLHLEPGTSLNINATPNTQSPAPSVSGSDGIVIVIDLLPTTAQGTEAPLNKGLPTVTENAEGVPTIAIEKGDKEPSVLTIAPVIVGAGRQVLNGQTVTVQYTAVSWKGAKPYDTTWASDRTPVSFKVGAGETFEGMDRAVLEQTVGSRILLVAPEDYAYAGKGTLVFAIDILAVSGGSKTPETTAPSTPTTKKK